jgi:8-oxo-dGTP pyrophosphatase MutT (NUDIX family)
MTHDAFVQYLRDRLTKPLPGWTYQQKMSPIIGGKQTNEPRIIPPDARKSGVAALLIPGLKGSELVFTIRSQYVSHHKGQISFPGGRAESHETIIDTALRETQEELGIHYESISVIGNLSPLYVPPSHSHMHVIVGALDHSPFFEPNMKEVEEVFSISIHALAYEYEIVHLPKMRSQDFEVIAPCWHIHPKNHLWGATAMCVSELVGLYKDFIDEIS